MARAQMEHRDRRRYDCPLTIGKSHGHSLVLLFRRWDGCVLTDEKAGAGRAISVFAAPGALGPIPAAPKPTKFAGNLEDRKIANQLD